MWANVAERVAAERELDEVADRLLSEPWPPPRRPARAPCARTPSTGTFGPAEDPLRSIPAEIYVERLTGQEVGPSRKILCPLHNERTPSFHVFPDGWHCIGCHRSGDVYALASGLWQLAPRGRGFLELRRRLAAQLWEAQMPDRDPPPLDEVAAFITKYVVVGSAAADFLALWCQHTWAFEAALTTPYPGSCPPSARAARAGRWRCCRWSFGVPGWRSPRAPRWSTGRATPRRRACCLVDHARAFNGTDCSANYSAPYAKPGVGRNRLDVLHLTPLYRPVAVFSWQSYGVFKNQGSCVSFVAT